MSYSGEDQFFRFTDGCCEALPGAELSASHAAEVGRRIAGHFRRFNIGCERFSCLPIVHALAGGISEAGKEVYICENTDMQSLKFSSPLLSADCGIFAADCGSLSLRFFDKKGFPVSSGRLQSIFSGEPAPRAEKNGKMIPVTSFSNIYISNIADSLGDSSLPLSASVSCGDPMIRELWQGIFSGSHDCLVFQVSDSGEHVNAYSAENGFISEAALRLACAVSMTEPSGTIYLPESFHFAAESTGRKIVRFSGALPDEATDTRFLTDSLFMCAVLASHRESFYDTLSSLPCLAESKLMIPANFAGCGHFTRTLPSGSSRIVLTRCGRNLLSLAAQSCSVETARELCSEWYDKLRYMCNGGCIDQLEL